MPPDSEPDPPQAPNPPSPPPQAEPEKPKLTFDLIRYFWRFLRPDKPKIVACAALLALLAIPPAIIGMVPHLLGQFWNPQKLWLLWWLLGGLTGLIILYLPVRVWADYLAARVGAAFSQRVKLAIFSKIGRLPSQEMSFQSTGDLAYRSTGDVNNIERFLMQALPPAVINFFQIFYVFGCVFFLAPYLSIAILLILPVFLLVMRIFNRRLTGFAQQIQGAYGASLNRLVEGVVGYRDLVASGRFHKAVDAFNKGLERLRDLNVRSSLVNGIANAFPMFLFNTLIFGIYFLMLARGVPDKVGDGEYLAKVISLAVLVNTLYLTVLQIVNFSIRGALAAPSFSAVRKMLAAPEVQDVPRGAALAGGEIRFENVTFRYSPQGPPVLAGGSFTIESGSFAAIVGQTGSGKTTLFHLLLRLLEPTEGAVRIGGMDLRKVPLEDLRQFVGFIPQNPFMFDASIRENILMATEQTGGVDEQRLLDAVRTARLAELIERRGPEGGLDAPVGVGGATLSGGERQRLALARILIRDPQVIICDEYTANIDNATARLINDALAQRFAGKTRVVITHQLYSIRGADHILVLDRGRIVAQGTHDDLLARGGLYKEMWEVQRLD